MIKQISAEELENQIKQNKDLILIDVREVWEYEFTHIDKSQNIPLGNIFSATNKFKSEDEIVVYCHHGIRSMRAANLLTQLGFKNIRNLTGGIDAFRSVDDKIKFYK